MPTNTRQPRVPIRRVAAAVFWSFFGVRRSREHEQDAVGITPLQAIAGGLIGAAIVLATLLTIAHWVAP